MESSRWNPDMIIGIDFGMTCTGVAWSMGPEWAEPRTFQQWPGLLAHELRNKVDTCVSYDSTTHTLAAWGFTCRPDDERFEYNDLFKLYLDPQFEDHTGSAPKRAEVWVWFKDYLRSLAMFIRKHFDETVPRFEQKRLEFVFSVPTTWKDPAMIASLERSIKEAGIGLKNKERASVYLTEAEAAAVYTSRQFMKLNDTFLVCDIGGGTTDLNVLKVSSIDAGSMGLTPLCWTEGMPVGSTIIDFKVQLLISERLERMRPAIEGDRNAIAVKMMQKEFTAWKCSFGNDSFPQTDLLLPVPGMEPGVNLSDANVVESKLVLGLADLKCIFDQQLQSLFGSIDRQLETVHSRTPMESISYLILSGGLGSSSYIQQHIQSRYQNDGNSSLRNIKGLKVLVAEQPQIAVSHGLVMARTQACKGGVDVLALRCAPVSYGVVCREPYDPAKHGGQLTIQDKHDKKLWVENQIAWIVRRGDMLDATKGVAQTYQMRLDLGEESLPWKTHIVTSTLPPDKLPQNASESGVAMVCELEFALEAQDFTVRNSKWYNVKKPFQTGTFQVRVIVGTGLKFEVWNLSRDKVLSRAHAEIHVDWARAVTGENLAKDGTRMYRIG